ncbi:hypothetical protein EPUS_06131 [Endocarpon pusillum Z07020]|uniref:Heterokaryon incompatibility domain-containing protein n=1 Tax=Endocarpon pusillum (strain Z07020 / HMAS-L-300199) TaxID=1263415 RepID=U1I376_ENDPU|nr:uncharacterized protein EPUS_06131 [Endocarpon pusillum Z07020]ERF76469.1 hypothetical protein EPUS_06131 [Endocarpon pusillum Z07020]
MQEADYVEYELLSQQNNAALALGNGRNWKSSLRLHLPLTISQRHTSLIRRNSQSQARQHAFCRYINLGAAKVANGVDVIQPVYKYQPVKNADEFRLLRLEPGRGSDPIRCRLENVSLRSKPKYEALSYTWGDPQNTKAILCGDGRVDVTISLFTALERLRYPHAERDIYSQAERVLIWLGKGFAETGEAFLALEKLDAYFRRNLEHYSPNHEVYVKWLISVGNGDVPYQLLTRDQAAELRNFEWDSIGELLHLPWFTRVWTLQEYVRGREAVMLCGEQSVLFECASKPITELWLQFISLGRFGEIGLTNNFPLESVWSIRQMTELHSDRFSRKADIISLAEKHNARACKDPRDKLFGLLGLAKDVSRTDWEIQPRYDIPVEEVYKRFAVWCIKKRNSLEIFSSRKDYKVRSNLRLPSWVPDWSEEGGKGDMDIPLLKSKASGNSSSRVTISIHDDNVLLVDGVLVDKVKRLATSYHQMSLWDDFRDMAAELQHGVNSQTRQQMLRFWRDEDLVAEYIDGLLEAQMAVQRYCKPSASPHALRHIAWFEMCRDIASEGMGQMSSERYEKFWRTMISNHTIIEYPAPSSFRLIFEQYLKQLEDLQDGRRKSSAPTETAHLPSSTLAPYIPASYTDEEHDRWRIMRTLIARTRRKRFCSTDNGRLGWTPDPAQEGDLICIFYGAKVPHVLRPCGDGRYRLLGGAYLHGMMDGEAMQMKDLKVKEFALC